MKTNLVMMLIAGMIFYLFLMLMAVVRYIAGTTAAVLFICDGLFILIIMVNLKNGTN